MPVLLTTSRHLPALDTYDTWCATGSAPAGLPAVSKVADLGQLLEDAFEGIFATWTALARDFTADTETALLGHTATCNTNVSDFGTMLAWSALYETWRDAGPTVLVVCDDPWLFRHLRGQGGEALAPAPGYRIKAAALRLRGFLARCRYALTAAAACWRLAGDARRCPPGRAAIISYGHPASDTDGRDAYFGDLMSWCPDMVRMMHTDCPVGTARRLGAGGRSFSLHAWGSAGFALGLPWRIWRPRAMSRFGDFHWLARRAVLQDAGTGQAAAIAWQMHCQARWLAAARPRTAIWPWEHHGWERRLARRARETGVPTVGYQHSVVGRRHWVHVPASDPEGAANLPARIVCNGAVWRAILADYGVDTARTEIGGALRYDEARPLSRDPAGPVFVALPFAQDIAVQMVAAISALAAAGEFEFIARGHPMNPTPLPDVAGVRPAPGPLHESGGVAAVLYAATTVGLEAVIGGLPTVRFVPEGCVSIDIMPGALTVPAAGAAELEARLRAVRGGAVLPPVHADVFHRPDPDYWRRLCAADSVPLPS